MHLLATLQYAVTLATLQYPYNEVCEFVLY